ncbi:hypothetical protein GF337_10445 [candidate division KSB1 bacterium]|nr:hypothetical protein [candidate division KSB1 bacterium]
MKIELIVDENCISLNMFLDMINRLSREFSDEDFTVTIFNNDRHRLNELDIKLLPAWFIDGELIHIRPDDYRTLKNKITEKL